MSSLQPRLTHPKLITLNLASMQPRVLLQMPTRSVIIAFSRSLPTKSSRRLNDAESLTSFKLNGNVYAFDSTTVDLCLNSFEWALFRKRKGGIKVHPLYDFETQIPTFFHITPAKVHDTKAMDVIPYEENSFYIFDRVYNDFKRLHNIESIGAYFVIRGKTNNDFKPMKWKRRFPPESGIQSDAIGYMAGQLTMEKYPNKIVSLRSPTS